MQKLKLLIVALVVCCSGVVNGASGLIPGMGTSASPYLIEDLADFNVFANTANATTYWASGKYVKLTCDLDLSHNGTYARSPISPDADTVQYMKYGGIAYGGVFDGNDHKISNMTIVPHGYAGLFGKISSSGSVSALELVNVVVCSSTNNNSNYCYGGVAGYNEGIIDRCKVSGSIDGDSYVGGVVGYNTGTVTKCSSTCIVQGLYDVGGLIGRSSGKIRYSFASSIVVGKQLDAFSVAQNTGGLVGALEFSPITYQKPEVYQSYSDSAVTGHVYVGGLVGSSSSVFIDSCYAKGTASGDMYVGGLLGYIGYTDMSPDCYIAKCYSVVTVADTGETIGGLIGGQYLDGRNITSAMDCLWNGDLSSPTVNYSGVKLTTEQMKTAMYYSINNWFGTIWTIDDGNDYPHLVWENVFGEAIIAPVVAQIPLAGSGAKVDPWLISSKNDLLLISSGSWFWDKHFRQTKPIDLNGEIFNRAIIGNGEWQMFTGSYAGGGNTISNMTIRYYTNNAGLFSKAENAVISGVKLVNASVTGNYPYVGLLIGNVINSEIVNCYGAGSVVGGQFVGGLAGSTTDGVVSECRFDGTVNGLGGSYTGGLVGHCYATEIDKSSANVMMNGSEYVGGLIGEFYWGKMNQCYTTGVVNGKKYVGGLTGNLFKVSTADCYSQAAVHGTGKYVGGLAGSFATGVTSIVENCYATGHVTGVEYIGGLFGFDSYGGTSVVLSSFWDKQSTGHAQSVGGIGLTTLEMQTEPIFINAGWDFVGETANGSEDIWRMPYGVAGYPILSFQKDIPGDLAGGYGVDVEDFAMLSAGWLSKYDMPDLATLAANWLAGK